MGIRLWVAMAAAAVGGIYLTSEEGKKAREALQKKKSIFEPIIKDLIKEANSVLDGSKKINSSEIRANVELLTDEAKKTLLDLNLDKTAEIIKEAIKVASKKIKVASNETSSKKAISSKTSKTKISSAKKVTKTKPTSIKPLNKIK